jgi:hypothetical protein
MTLFLHVAAKHAPVYEQMGAVGLSVEGRVARHEHDELLKKKLDPPGASRP